MHQTAEQRRVCIFVPSFGYLYFSLSISLHLCLSLLFHLKLLVPLSKRPITPKVKPTQLVPKIPFHHPNVKDKNLKATVVMMIIHT